MKGRVINKIYFDEVSEMVDDWLTVYIDFDNVDLTIKPSNSSVTFIIKYRGRGSYVLENGVHASTQLDYGWYVSLLGSKSLLEEDVLNYEDVSVSIKKSVFNRRKITVLFNGEKRKGLVFYGAKVILTKLVSEDATYNNLQQSKKPIGDRDLSKVPLPTKKITWEKIKAYGLVSLGILFELLVVLLISYIVHRFVYGYMTSLETLFVYGFIGFLIYVNNILEKLEQIAVFLIAVALFSTLPYGGFAFAMICIYLLFLRKNETQQVVKTNILISPNAKKKMISFLRKTGQIAPDKDLGK